MNRSAVQKKILETFPTMPVQLQTAARYVVDHPQDAALLTMREQARNAGVQPATMTRLAKYLGFDGYEDMRSVYADALRASDLGFSKKAGSHFSTQRLRGHTALAADLIETLQNHISAQSAPEAVKRFVEMADRLVEARRIFCLGMRSSHAVAWHFHYIVGLCGAHSVYLEGGGATGSDALARATSNDVLFLVSVSPYTRATIELAEYAAAQGITIFAITDSEAAPLARIAKQALVVATESPSFFHTMAPAFAAAEILAALVAGRLGDGALDALRSAEQHFTALRIHLRPGQGRKRS